MDLINKKNIKDLLKRRGAKAEKGLGQHFILSKKALAQMIAAAEIKKNDTQELAKTGAKIIAVEKDPMMLDILKETLADYKNIKIIQADARTIGVGHLSTSKYKIVANLPYNVATFLIHQWLEAKRPPKTMVLMIQKEVAQRIVAKPPRMNLLAASVQFYANAKIVDYVKKNSFWPQPKVDSAIIKIVPKKKPLQKMRNAFFVVAKAGFSHPRKQLIGNLAKKLNLPKEQILLIFKKAGIPELVRAENLNMEQWTSLTPLLIHN
jgi:16S rRNA (adenine1518-N6/adenine1519-N6)-dimethyltransferase